MRAWSVHAAKARFSEMFDGCLKNGPQMITWHGAEAAVLVPAKQWQSLSSQTRPTLKELLLSAEVRNDLNLPPRGRRRRQPDRSG